MRAKSPRPLAAARTRVQADTYAPFDQLDGRHDLQGLLPEGVVLYPARRLQQGKVIYFNFQLAREMGLLPEDHPDQLNASLEKKLLDTFSIQIINEFDQQKKKAFKAETLKEHPYMATRYLQLQHPSKQGKTSGDGRSIWNGQVEFKGKTWDVSSRGTGVTCLAPGSVEAQRPLQTGKEEFGYGCGQAELDELIGCSLMAEIMHLQGLHTERVLCVIELNNKVGIGVRAAPSLIRPAHLFLFLKQNRLAELKKVTDYLIEQQAKNQGLQTKKSSRYSDWALHIAERFATFTARLDIDYIFAWLDWDGDNVLADAGIIDYGSVRQFGIRHDQYRYDDIERFSTNLNEQKQKARLLVQVMAQIADALTHGARKPLKEFVNSAACKRFDEMFLSARRERWLFRLGFSEQQRKKLETDPQLLKAFEQEFQYFERAKISGPPKKVSDGVNHPALFNMRKAVLSLGDHFVNHGLNHQGMELEDLFRSMLSQFAKTQDLKLRAKHRGHLSNLQRLYKMLLVGVFGKNAKPDALQSYMQRLKTLNQEDRITGNALINTVDELLTLHRKKFADGDLQKVIDQLIRTFMGHSEDSTSIVQKPRRLHLPEVHAQLLATIEEHSEDI